MTAQAMLASALMLGGFVAAAGAYGILYCLARMWRRGALAAASEIAGAAMIAVAIAIVAFTPLHLGWKILVAVSCAGYIAIPPITWRYLDRLHHRGRTDDARPA
jgi:hypothetical protein